jgi:predicted acylesterase/phospholipase RssA
MRSMSTLLAALMCTACVTVDRLAGPPGASPQATPTGFTAPVRSEGMDRLFFETHAESAVARAASAATDGSVDILALSGGGAGGAYGAGVLVGLSEAGARPQYEIVTGVSTGALIAPLAFLGRDWDDELAQAYATDASSDLMQSLGIRALFNVAIFNGKPLHDLVNRFVTDELLTAVAQESAKGRLLLVASTNLDRGEAVIWDLGAIAQQGGPQARRLFIEVLIASASVPGVFPPVMINVDDHGQSFQEMHVDGGASTPFFIAPEVAVALGYAPEALRGGHIFVISNSQLAGAPQTTRFNMRSIVSRSFTTVMTHQTRAALAQTDAFAERNGMSFRFTTIPRDYPYSGSLAFAPEEMSALFEYGRRCAAQNLAWVDAQAALARAAQAERDPQAVNTPCPTPTAAE